jgi:diguanylate cyclase (GGDEF)-like protein/PAS domain S-box-containing protein
MPARLAAACFGVWMTALGAAYYVLTEWRTAVWAVAGLSAALVVVGGMRRNEPAHRGPWRLLALGIVLSASGAVAPLSLPGIVDWAPRTPSIGDAILLANYLVLSLSLLLFVRFRLGGGRDRGGLLDALTLTAGAALLTWMYLISPHLRDTGLSTTQMWLAVSYPVGDVLCLALLTRLLTSSDRRGFPMVALGLGVAAMLAGDVAYNLGLLTGDAAVAGGLTYFALYAGAGTAALHPGMVQLTAPVAVPATDLGRQRLALLALASMVAPIVLVLESRRVGAVADMLVVASLCGLTFMLVLARLSGIVGNHRQAIARERGLREASAALVSAADPDEVGVAVNTAVAQLLPTDVAHRVVLAMAIAEPEEPQSEAAAAQAAEDRATGTAARVVHTRDVDWAVAVRLAQFNRVLRCPLVLQDRPTGDPLVGVLHIGGPAWALLGLQRAVEVLASQVALALERIALNAEVNRRNSEAYFRTLVLNTSDVILILDADDRVSYASPSAGPVLGNDDPVGTHFADIIHPVDRARLQDVLDKVRDGAGSQQGLDFRAIGRRRTAVMLEMHCRDLRDDATVNGVVVTLRDVTERRQLERELTHQAFHDSLTGLANRVLYADRLGHALSRAARDGSVVGVLFIDLDDFKIVNDTLGHAVGDQLLVAVAERISGALRADDTAARLGGDEFAALIENVQHPDAVEETAERILQALAEPFIIDGEPLHAVASIGITTTPEADNADELLRQADLALYVAKGAGKGQWRRYQSSLHSAMVARLELRSALDHAVNEGHFLLQYQPIVDLRTDEAIGFEALVRWHHPVRGTISPDEFIEVAEESGLIVPIGRWVLDQALHTVAQWQRILPPGRLQYVSVNVSVRQFRSPGFVDQIRQSLEYVGVPPQALMLEITETLLMRDDEQIWSDLAELRDLGIRIAIDDFGTGYSSLGYLRQRPIDVLKIDKSFIDDMVDSPQQLALVSGIVTLAQTLNLTVVAEGIESVRHRDMLAELGCPLGQGYLFSRPVSATEALTWMKDPLAIAGIAA